MTPPPPSLLEKTAVTGDNLPITIDEIAIGDPPDAWRAAGFTVTDDGTCQIGAVRVRLTGPEAGRRIRWWTLHGLADGISGIDGLPTTPATGDPTLAPATGHPNGARLIDHVVVATPDCDRSIAALREIGLESRRERTADSYGAPMRQNFFRLGEVLLELVGPAEVAGNGPAAFFGLALTVDDLDAAAMLLGEKLGSIKDAVQDGRRIATLRHKDLGMSVATALMS